MASVVHVTAEWIARLNQLNKPLDQIPGGLKMACGTLTLGAMLWTILQLNSYGDVESLAIPIALQSYVNTYSGWSAMDKHRGSRTTRDLLSQIPEIHDADLQDAVWFGRDVVEKLTRLETNLGHSRVTVQPGTPAHGQLIASYPHSGSLDQSRDALVAVRASQFLSNNNCQRFGLQDEQCGQLLTNFKLTTTPLGGECEKHFGVSEPCTDSKYRSFDGTCNNPNTPAVGKSFSGYGRLLQPIYDDGLHSPRGPLRGRHLPSPRQVSLAVASNKHRSDGMKTLSLVLWSQFIEHDLAHSALTKMINTGSSIVCCREDGGSLSPRHQHPFCLPIQISNEDPTYSKYHMRCMNYVRSALAIRSDCSFGPAEQMNQATHFLDGSMIYGPTLEVANSLRKFANGLLLVDPVDDGRNFLPTAHDPEYHCQLSSNSTTCYRSGDMRVNQHPHLTTMHTVWMREHNRVASQLAALNPAWDDERLYQETRRIVIAELQHITYREWLPSVVGSKYSKKLGLKLKKSGFSNEYDDEVNPSVSNSFATAGLKFVNSMMQGTLGLYKEDRTSETNIPLRDNFNKPHVVERPGHLDLLVRGLATQRSQMNDLQYVEDVTSLLYQDSRDYGLDVVSLDVQRGRDHGLPGYNHYRRLCGLPAAVGFSGFLDTMSKNMVDKLETLYAHPDDVDLLIGGMSERPVEDSILGFTFRCIVGEQMLRTRKGDRYFYDLAEQPGSFTAEQLAEIKKTTLARIFCDNGDDIRRMQPNVFHKLSSSNLLTSCNAPSSIAKPNLEAWRDQISSGQPEVERNHNK